YSNQNTAEICTVVAVVEQADVPVVSHGVQELHQRSRFLRELKAIDFFMFRLWRMAAYQMPQMQFGHFVISEVGRWQPVCLEVLDQPGCFRTVMNRNADKDMRFFCIRVTVIEFSDAAITEKPAEGFEHARFLRDG